MYKKLTELIIDNRKYTSDTIDIDFLVEFDDDPEPNVAEISLWNPSEDTIGRIKKGTKIIVNAGFVGDLGVIISGTVGDYEVVRYDVDKELKLYVGDGIDIWNTVIKKTYKNINADSVVRNLLESSGLRAKIDLGKNITYPQIAFNGPIQDALKRIAQDTDSKFFIKNGQGYMVKDSYKEKSIFLLNRTSGLIGSPERVIIKEKVGYRISCLLQHRINVGSYIRIESRSVNGDFRVIKGKHSEVTEMEVLPI
jgi:hypothetical protein